MHRRDLSSWEVSSIVLLLWHPTTQLPTAIGSPVFHCPVPVVQGCSNLIPVDTQLKLFSPPVFFRSTLFRWLSKIGEKHFGSFSDVCFPTVFFFFLPRWRDVSIVCAYDLIVCLWFFLIINIWITMFVSMYVSLYSPYDCVCMECLVCNSLVSPVARCLC